MAEQAALETQVPDTESRWSAVLGRDADADGRFVYAVTTTGIYCRPTCPSRRPHRENVQFFSSPAEARHAGFRSCRRCRPDESRRRDPAEAKVLAACRYIEAQSDGVPALEDVAAHVGASAAYLQKTFKRLTGVSPRAYADALRVRRFKRELRDGGSIAGALYGAGYGASSRLYEAAPAQLGMTPKAYRDRGRAQRIRYATVPCTLGVLLVAATTRGLCAVRLGDSETALEGELRDEFSDARLVSGGAGLATWIGKIVAYLDGKSMRLDLPLDVRGTVFERRVWEAIRRVPYGATMTYGKIAAAIRQPRAIRAVANACARNPVALVVPCHRVVPKAARTAGGYRWGAQRKRRLLALERARATRNDRASDRS